MPTWTAGLAGGTLQLNVSLASQNQAGNYSTVSWSLYIIGNGLSYNYNNVGYTVVIGGAVYNGNYTYDFRSQNTKLIAAGSTNVGHDSAGNLTINCSGHTNYTGTSVGGPADCGGYYTLPRIPKIPNPPAISVAQPVGRSVDVTISVPAGYDDGGATVTSVTSQYSKDGGPWTGNKPGAWGLREYTALAPGKYTFRAYATNSVGNSVVTTAAPVTILSGGKRLDVSDWTPLSITRRYDGAKWVEITSGQRYDETAGKFVNFNG